MPQEVELKLHCDKRAVPALGRKLAALGAQKQRAVTLVSTYLDTPDLALHTARMAVRLRQAGRHWVQTVKQAGESESGLSVRQEWEHPYTGELDFSGVNDAALRARLDACRAALAPVFTTRFKRTRWLLTLEGATIEIAFDDGGIEVGAYHEPLHELELELLSGPHQALVTLHALLADVTPLVGEDKSKAERGYALRQAAVMKASSVGRKIKADSTLHTGMDLLLWRHAEAEDGPIDLKRPLTARGQAQAERVARWLQKNQPRKLRVMSSPAKRALQTVSAFTNSFDTHRRLAPGASPADILAATGWPDHGDAVLVVGHQPTFGQLAALLLGGDEAAWSIKKGALWWFSNRTRNVETQTVLRAVISPEFLE